MRSVRSGGPPKLHTHAQRSGDVHQRIKFARLVQASADDGVKVGAEVPALAWSTWHF